MNSINCATAPCSKYIPYIPIYTATISSQAKKVYHMLLLFSIGFFIFFRKTSIFLFSFFLYFFATGPTFVVFAKNKTGADADMIRGDACLIHACVSARRENRLWLGGVASRNGVYMRVHAYRKKPQPTTPQAILTSIYFVQVREPQPHCLNALFATSVLPS